MRRFSILICLVTACVMLVMPQEASAKKKAKKKTQTEVAAPVKKKSAYEKFTSKKGLETVKGFITIHRDGNDIWLEIPDSLMGRRLIQRSIVVNSSSKELGVGKDISNNPIYQLARTDSLILFQHPSPRFYVNEDGDNIRTALEASNACQTVHALPIKYRNADSTAYVVKANALFDYKRKEVVDLVGYSFGELLVIAKSNVNDKLSRIVSVESFDTTVGVRKEAGFNLTLAIAMFGMESSHKPVFTSEILSSFTLMPEKEVAVREADDRVGVRKTDYQIYNQSGVILNKKAACRWDLNSRDHITFYVDTLLGHTWSDAVKKGLEAWNVAFEKIGYRDMIRVLPFPSDDPSFRVDNPFINVVTAVGGIGRNISADILTDKSTGEIMGVKMMVPDDFVTGVRWNHAFDICDVDPRYRGHMIADDAVGEVLTAKIMSLFGRCLGLERNNAGSHAWSPAQLSDVAFTQANGITASVTDDVVFNLFAKPGDKEKGLVTVVDRIGPYDEYAIEWLYSHDDSKESRDSLIMAHAGDPTYFFAYKPRGTVSDPRVVTGMLGNDPIQFVDASLAHYRFVAENASKWLLNDSVPADYKDLFVDWLHTAVFDLVPCLSAHIGGMYANEVGASVDKPKFEPVPEKLQRACMKKMFEILTGIDWLDSDPELRLLPGPNKELSHFARVHLVGYASIYPRLLQVAMSVYEAGSTYTVDEYLDDMESYLFKGISKGKLRSNDDMTVSGYISVLMRMSPIMKQKYDDYKKGGLNSFSADMDFRAVVTAVPIAYVEDFELIAWNRMQKLSRMLKKAKALCGNENDRRKYDYLISLTEVALGK